MQYRLPAMAISAGLWRSYPICRHTAPLIFFSVGTTAISPLDAAVKYRSKGLSLYYNPAMEAWIIWKVLRGVQPFTLRKEIIDLPVEKYDLVINDFEYITAAACAKKKITSVHFGHQASFQSISHAKTCKQKRHWRMDIEKLCKGQPLYRFAF